MWCYFLRKQLYIFSSFLSHWLIFCCHNLEPFSSRREVYGILKAEGILLPRYAVLNRDPNNPQGKN